MLSLVFHLIHLSVICVNLTGWIFRRMRRIHLIVVMLTLFSWIGLGYRYGFGYCFLTDLHWQLLESQGVKNLPNSYIKYIADAVTGLNFNPTVVDICTGTAFAFAVVASIVVNRDLFRKL